MTRQSLQFEVRHLGVLVVAALAACGSNAHPLPVSVTAPTQTQAPAAHLTPDVTGRVREVNGGPLSGVTIVALDRAGYRMGEVATTGADGLFAIEQFPHAGLLFQRSGYWPAMWKLPASDLPSFEVTAKMQRELRVPPGSILTDVISADDLAFSSSEGVAFWEGEYSCSPCKLIVVGGSHASLTLRLSWSGQTPLTLWAGDGYAAPTVYVAGQPGQSELVVTGEQTRSINTVLAGFDTTKGPVPMLDGAISFRLTVEAP